MSQRPAERLRTAAKRQSLARAVACSVARCVGEEGGGGAAAHACHGAVAWQGSRLPVCICVCVGGGGVHIQQAVCVFVGMTRPQASYVYAVVCGGPTQCTPVCPSEPQCVCACPSVPQCIPVRPNVSQSAPCIQSVCVCVTVEVEELRARLRGEGRVCACVCRA
jgi:hypothetical protein